MGATSVVLSTQHVEGHTPADIKELVRPYVLATLPEGWMCPEAEFYVNPTGKFVIGGPDGDAGLTGRKIIVDTYGGAAPHGGGAFSGKDPTKVDRSAAYAARYLAKNVVAAGLARRCVIQLSYAIGVSKPLSIYVDTYGTGEVDELRLGKILNEVMNLSPRGIREHLQLNRPIYARTSAYGHFGRDSRRRRRLLLGAHRPRRRAPPRLQLTRRAWAQPTTPPPRRILYGRRQGPKLRPGARDLLSELLPRVGFEIAPGSRSIRWRCSHRPPRALWLEIGFGGGEHLAALAAAHPDVGFLGVEPFINGVAKLLRAVEAGPLANVRILKDDARLLLEALPAASLERAFVLFPDPWPKLRHHKRRIVNRATAGRSRPGGPARGRAAPGHRRCRLCPLDAGRGAGRAALRLDGGARRATGASRPPTGRPPATRARPAGPGGRRCS